MVQVRKKSAVNYAEAADSDSDGEAPKVVRKVKAEVGGPSPKVVRSTPKVAAQRKRRAPSSPDGADAESSDSALLGIVKKHGTALTVAAKDFIQRYKDNRVRATAEILTFLIQACGTDEVVSEEGLEELEVDQLKQELDEKAQAEGLEDPFKAKGSKNFRSNYLELWDKIIREAHHADVLFDQYLLDRVINLTIALNTSVVRDFRRVATLTAVQLVSSFIHVTKVLTEGRDTAQRQLAVEEKKKGGKGSSERAAAFKRLVDRSHTRINELNSYTDSIFQAVCQHRFRDCAEDIRATVIDGIGYWLRSLPSQFLSDQYLKYIAWALSDKDAVVRDRAVSSLLGLYAQRDNVSALHDFTERFSERFRELIYDIDEGVAIRGVQLLTALVRLEEIPASSVKEVYTLLGDESHGVRHAVAELVQGMLQEQGERALKQVSKHTPKKGARKKAGEGQHSDKDLQLAGLLQLMHMLANEEHAAEQGEEEEALPLPKETAAQVMDALFDRVEVLKDWSLLVDWLKGSKAAEHFGEAGVTNLAQVLRHAMVKATGGQLLAGHVDKKKLSKDAQESQASARQEATLVLMKDLPTLLKKLQTDPRQAAAVVSLIPELKLEIYSLKRQDKAFWGLMASVKEVLFKHDDMQVALECARALAVCGKEGTGSIKDAALLGLRQCSEEAVKRLAAAVDSLGGSDPMEISAAVKAFQESDGEEEHEVLYGCRVALGRLKALLQLDPGAAASKPAYEALNRVIEVMVGDQPLTQPIATAAMASMMLLLLWQFRGMDAEHPDRRGLRELAQRRELFSGQLQSILDGEDEGIKWEACNVLSDLCLCFSAQRVEGTPLAEAGFRPSDAAVRAMWRCWEGVITAPVEEGADEEAATKVARSKQAAASQVAQQVVFQSLPQWPFLAAQLVSHYVGQGKEVTDAVKEMCRLLKKSSNESLPGIYLEAMKAAYARSEQHMTQDEHEDDSVLDEFVLLSQRIAQSYAGFNASAPALAHIAGRGAAWALQGAPDRLLFLQGVACFLGRLPAAQATSALQQVETAAAACPDCPASAEDAEYPWTLYFEFLDLLKDREAKAAGPKSVLKRGGGSAKKSSRKIMFEGAENEGASDEERENQEPMHQEEEEAQGGGDPGPSARHAQQAAARRAQQPKGRRQQMAAAQQQLQAAADAEAAAHGGWRTRKGATPAEAPAAAAAASRRGRPAVEEQQQRRRQQREEEIEEEEEEEEEEEQIEEEEEENGQEEEAEEIEMEEEEEEAEEEEVLPTEEQLPAAGGGGRRRQLRVQPMFQEEAEEEEQEEDEGEDGLGDDADLEVEIRGRGKQPAAVDPQPQVPEEEDAEDPTQDVRRARRRRR